MIFHKKEFENLKSYYLSKKFEILVLDGEEGIGKTFLLQSFLKRKAGIYFAAQNVVGEMNRKFFCEAINSSGLSLKVSEENSWEELVQKVLFLSTQQKLVLVFDDYLNLFKSYPKIKDLFEEYFEKNEEANRMLVILSDDFRIKEQDKIQKSFPKLNYLKMELYNVTFTELIECFPKYSQLDKTVLWGITSGIPRVLSEINPEVSIKENIMQLFFDKNALFKNYTFKRMKEIFREEGIYNSILYSVANGSKRIKDIARDTSIESNKLYKYIHILVKLGILYKQVPILDENSKKSFYEIRNTLTLFVYLYVLPNYSKIEAGEGRKVFRQIVIPNIDCYLENIYKRICFQYCWELALRGNFSFDIKKAGVWWGYNNEKIIDELDIVAMDVNNVCIGKCYWTGPKITIKQISLLLEKVKRFEHVNRHIIVFAKNSFTDAALEYSANNRNIRLISLKYMN